jgi:MFS family permease
VNNDCHSRCGGIPIAFIWGDPEAFKRASDAEQMLKYGRKPDQGGPPKRERGDIYIMIGAIVGIIVGGVVGVFVVSPYIGFTLGFLGGIIVGGTAGATIGSLIKKWRLKAGKKRQDDDSSGFPFSKK